MQYVSIVHSISVIRPLFGIIRFLEERIPDFKIFFFFKEAQEICETT